VSTDITHLVMLRYHIDETRKRIEVLQKEIDEQQTELERKCTHPTYKEDRHYTEGGYDYVSVSSITHTCTLCGKVIKSFTDPGHKGSFA
jgi:hypothetical protein